MYFRRQKQVMVLAELALSGDAVKASRTSARRR